MPKLKKQVGMRVRGIRKEKGWTQQRLAEKVDLSVNMIGCIERGEKFPSAETFLKLSTALKIPTQELFIFDGQPAVKDPEKEAALENLRGLLDEAPSGIVKSIYNIVTCAFKNNTPECR